MSDFQADLDAIASIPAIPQILDVVCRTTGLGFAAVARVTDERWVTCHVRDNINLGLAIGDELAIGTTICHEIRQSGQLVVIDHVAQSEMFRAHPTPQLYGFESYISVPIVREDGSFFGTLCALDPEPAKLENPATIGMFTLFAHLIATQLDALARVELAERQLIDEQKLSELREQFIAVLGHDLRNPLASIQAGAELVKRGRLTLDEMLHLTQGSISRMSTLIDNILDFARGRLGNGIDLERRDVVLTPLLAQVVDELRAASPDRSFVSHIAMDQTVSCDAGRIGQLLSNLLGNAVVYGAPGTPIAIDASIEDGTFGLSVTNHGDPIPAEALEKLFQPFFRGEVRASQQGLGLGLYICSEIARAHGGTLTATSTPDRTTFLFRMPARAA